MNQTPASFRLAERVGVVVGHTAVIGLLVSAAYPFIRAAERIVPGWDGSPYLWIAGGVALEGLLSERVVRGPWARRMSVLAYRLAEVVLLLISLKLILYARGGWTQLALDVARWPADPLSFLEGGFLGGAVFVLGGWALAGWFGEALLGLEGDDKLFGRVRDELLVADRAQARQQLRSLTFWLGAAAVVVTALVRSDLQVFGLSAPRLDVGLVNLVVYFGLGLLLLSLSQFALLRARWGLNQIPLRPQMAGRWAFYTLALLVIVGGAASLLPTRYSLGLMDLAGLALSWLTVLIYFVLALVLGPLGLLFAWLARVLNLPAPAEAPGLPPQLPALPPPPAAPETPAAWLELGRSVLFWVVFLAVLVGALVYYLRSRPEIAALRGRRPPGWAWLVARWRALRGGWRRVSQGAAELLQAGWRRWRPAVEAAAAWRYVRVRGLAPRDQVRFYYQALLRRARESALPRRPAQTPSAYEQDLQAALPEAAASVDQLTQAFLEAQYSQHPIEPAAAETARTGWEALRQALRRRRARAAEGGETAMTTEAK